MKMLNNASTAKAYGDIESNVVSIDAKNLGLITQMLSTNLYSNPIESFIRETVSNAWDSHVEAGVDEPITIQFYTDSNYSLCCKIEDYGVGLSPERFYNIYRNIGSSTKRDDNTQIGGFGIGRFSALSCSDVVNIDSSYKGIMYKYLMYKDGNNIKIDKLAEVKIDSVHKNGLAVTVRFNKDTDYDDILLSLKKIQYFPKVYLDVIPMKFNTYGVDYYNTSRTMEKLIEFQKEFNSLKIYNFTTFKTSTISMSAYHSDSVNLLLGNVLYSVDYNRIRIDTVSNKRVCDLNSISTNIAIKFNIGELEVTPNRESILYSQKNIDLINNRVNKVYKEIDDMIISNSSDCTDLFDYYERSKSQKSSYKLVNNVDSPILIDFSLNIDNVTYKGKKYTDYLFKMIKEVLDINSAELHYTVSSNSIYHILIPYVVCNGRITKLTITQMNNYIPDDRKLYMVASSMIYPNKKTFLIKDLRVKEICKRYVRELSEDGSDGSIYLLLCKSKMYLTKIIITHLKDPLGNAYDLHKDLVKVILDYVNEISQKIPELSVDNLPKDFLDKVDREKQQTVQTTGTTSKAVNWSTEINIGVFRNAERITTGNMEPPLVVTNIRYKLDEFKTIFKDKFVVYGSKDDIYLKDIAYIFSTYQNTNLHYDEGTKDRVIQIAETKKSLLKNLKNFMDINDFIKGNRFLQRVATANKIAQMFPYLIQISKYNNLNKISEVLKDTIVQVADYITSNDFKNNSYYHMNIVTTQDFVKDLVTIYEKNNAFDPVIMAYVKAHKNELEYTNFLYLLNGNTMSIEDKLICFFADDILKKKLFMPNSQTIRDVRNYTIYKDIYLTNNICI